eukprot:TRINITY_DN7996_c1_g1_i1.p1 TRINITY_DN7996_c1_g1~~TRINITY_DN7996_c1_g1_i1.p1  ORF type:complete len:305 (+),score=67.14 TRINITY_DN7996_c1_g1_i1:41-916(+)
MRLLIFLSIAIASTWSQDSTMGTDVPATTPEPTYTTTPDGQEPTYTTTPDGGESNYTTTPDVTTTMMETTIPKCDVEDGVVCDDPESLIEHIEHISHASDCQAICQNHPECNFWSHYAEEGHEHWGHCLMYLDCLKTTDHECFDEGTHECPPQPQHGLFLPIGQENEPRPGGKKCYCVSGRNSPDLDECDDGTSACADEFYPGFLCNEEENLIAEIEGIPNSSDCQAVCQNHDDCEFFNYYVEGLKGWCQLHSSCSNFVEHEWCTEHHGEHSCFAGPKYPDLDDCSYPELV